MWLRFWVLGLTGKLGLIASQDVQEHVPVSMVAFPVTNTCMYVRCITITAKMDSDMTYGIIVGIIIRSISYTYHESVAIFSMLEVIIVLACCILNANRY